MISPNTDLQEVNDSTIHPFPGRWVGGVSLIIAPLLFLTGMLLRMQYHFFFPQQLEAYRDSPALITTSYNFFVVGNILLWPAIVILSQLVGRSRMQLATWGGVFVMLGLFARTFQAGINHMAFRLVDIHGLDVATKTVADSYGAFNIISTLNGTIMFGWIILAIGCYFSKTMGLVRSICLALMGALMSGVLKGTSLYSIIAAAGLCVALVPLGFQVLTDGPKPARRSLVMWASITIAVTVVLFFLGQAG